MNGKSSSIQSILKSKPIYNKLLKRPHLHLKMSSKPNCKENNRASLIKKDS